MPAAHLAIWAITFLSIALMLVRPRGIAEVWWIAAGAAVLVAFRLVGFHAAILAVAKGTDVYLFLIGMMLLAQLAQVYGVFDWLAAIAVRRSKGSRRRLFALIYLFGTLVTILMSNDATAVVLTPAVLVATKKSKVNPLPYLLICAFVANAASFVLPISNPANLIVFQQGMPPLAQWLGMFLLASVVSIAATFLALRWCCRKELEGQVDGEAQQPVLSTTGHLTIAGIGIVVVVLLAASALGRDLGLPTCIASLSIVIALSIRERANPLKLALKLTRDISWSILPLVAGLFILVEAVGNAGALGLFEGGLRTLQHWHPLAAAAAAAFSVAVGTNLVNNLPLGLIAGAAVHSAHITGVLRNIILIAIDLGPNLSVTGSLATILWLIEIRKGGIEVSAWHFLKIGFVVMLPALALATLTVAFSR